MDLNEKIQSIFDKLENFLRTETVVGNPITIGEVTLIPIIEITFGFGSGASSSKDSKGMDGSGGGVGAGAKITPNAMMVIKGEEVSVSPLKNRDSLEKVLEMVPDILSRFTPKKEKEKEKEKEEKREIR